MMVARPSLSFPAAVCPGRPIYPINYILMRNEILYSLSFSATYSYTSTVAQIIAYQPNIIIHVQPSKLKSV